MISALLFTITSSNIYNSGNEIEYKPKINLLNINLMVENKSVL